MSSCQNNFVCIALSDNSDCITGLLCESSKSKSEDADIRPVFCLFCFLFFPFSGTLFMSMEELLLPLLSGLTALLRYMVAPVSCMGY